MKYAAAHLLHYTGLARLSRHVLGRRGRFVLMLHDVFGERRPDLPESAQRGLTTPEADRLLGWLRAEVPLLTPEAFLGSDAPGVLLTVDDGKANNHSHLLPLLEQHGVPAVFFVASQHVRDPRDWLPDARRAAATWLPDLATIPRTVAHELYDGLSPDQVVECDRHPLVTVGAHTVSHPRLTDCPDEQLATELTQAKTFLEAMLDREVPLFAYPYGDYDQRVARAVAAAGYSHAFAVETRRLGWPRLEIPRLHVESAAPAYLAAKLSGLFRRPLRGRP